MNRYYGKYRGKVANNVDPMLLGRIQVTVPAVLGDGSLSWALPCVAFAGNGVGLFMLPPVGANIWVEFEGGDPDYPIWSGCFYGSAAEVPALALAAPPVTPNIVIQSQGQNTLMISDVPGPTGGILLKTLTGAFISINDVGITISNGKGATITLVGPTVSINPPALVVT